MQNHFFRRPAVLLMTGILSATLLTATAGAAGLQTVGTQPYELTSEDFLPVRTETLQGIYVCSVPTAADGTFRCGSRVLQAGDFLAADALQSLSCHPAGEEEADLTLSYRPISDGQLGESAQMTVHVKSDKVEPPTAQDSSLETYKNIANNGKLQFSGGAEGEYTFTLVKEPKRGTVTLSNDGTFLYTPNKNKVGKDSFTYTVTDSAGNTSEEAKVTVQILKPSDAATYADLDGDYDQFEAMWLREAGLFSGKMLTDTACFEPDASLTRGEFLVMVMNLAEISLDDAQETSGFSDEASTPAWMQPYLSTALRCGIITGTSSAEGLVFQANESITCAQAAVMVQNILDLPQPETKLVFADDTVLPAWAEDSVQALSQAGLNLSCTDYNRTLTRREAANMLYQMSQLP